MTLTLPRAANDVVGRAEIQHTLAAALDAAVDGRAATLVVEGEAGSGKTLLMQWLMEHAAERGVLTVAARPVEGEAQLPLAVMTDVLRPLRGWTPRLLPEQRDVLEAAAGGVGEASTDRLLLAAATLALLATVAEDTPVLLVVDDAHWADPTSGRALSFALRRLLADRVLAVLTRRPTEELRIAGPWEPLELRGLAEPDIAALIEGRTGVTPPPGVVERIRDETLGNPLAVSHLAERLPVDALAGASPLPITLPLQEVARRTFAGLVRALPAGTRSALTVVAAAGSAAARIAPSALRVVRSGRGRPRPGRGGGADHRGERQRRVRPPALPGDGVGGGGRGGRAAGARGAGRGRAGPRPATPRLAPRALGARHRRGRGGGRGGGGRGGRAARRGGGDRRHARARGHPQPARAALRPPRARLRARARRGGPPRRGPRPAPAAPRRRRHRRRRAGRRLPPARPPDAVGHPARQPARGRAHPRRPAAPADVGHPRGRGAARPQHGRAPPLRRPRPCRARGDPPPRRRTSPTNRAAAAPAPRAPAAARAADVPAPARLPPPAPPAPPSAPRAAIGAVAGASAARPRRR